MSRRVLGVAGPAPVGYACVARVGGARGGTRTVAVAAEEGASRGILDRKSCGDGAVRAVPGLDGRALFHSIRVAVTAADSGPELDGAARAMDRGALCGSADGPEPVSSSPARARAVAERVGAGS